MAAFQPATPTIPPFNRISTYREPGRINLNTLYDEECVQSVDGGRHKLEQSTTNMHAEWIEFFNSRQADNSHNTDILAAPDIPTSADRVRPPLFVQSAGAFTTPKLLPNDLLKLDS